MFVLVDKDNKKLTDPQEVTFSIGQTDRVAVDGGMDIDYKEIIGNMQKP